MKGEGNPVAWSEAHDELLNHPKTAVLGASMAWNKYETVGRLLGFWWWALKYAPTGNLMGRNDAVIGAAVELNGEAARRFVVAMVEACWLDRSDGVFRIHDWPEYTRHYLKMSRFNGRPDKWQELLEVYPDFKAMEAQRVLMSNSRVRSGTTQTTDRQTDRPIKGRSAAEKMRDEVLNGTG